MVNLLLYQLRGDTVHWKLFFRVSLTLFLCSIVTYLWASVKAFPDHVYLGAEAFGGFRAGPFAARLEGTAAVSATGDIPVTNNIYLQNAPDIYGDFMSAEMTVSLFGVPIKSVAVDILQDVEVVPMGMTVGIRIDTTGLMVLGTGSVTLGDGTSVRPSEDLVKPGDIIQKIDNIEIRDHKQFAEYLDSIPKGSPVDLTIRRGTQILTVSVTCAVSADLRRAGPRNHGR
jgi:hypothetical protein